MTTSSEEYQDISLNAAPETAPIASMPDDEDNVADEALFVDADGREMFEHFRLSPTRDNSCCVSTSFWSRGCRRLPATASNKPLTPGA